MPPEPQPQVTSTPGAPSWLAPVTPVIPDHNLVRRIGGGSYGDVWLARNAVGTWRAVKVVFRDRFRDARPYEREFNGIRKFEPLSRSNEAFVDVLQIGRNDAQGCFYYVMELADDAGESLGSEFGPSSAFHPESYAPKTLAKVLRQRGRLPVGECLDLGLALNLGLAHLHRAGLIHRDIKPSNIIFVGGVPKLADIGLVIETSEARSFVGTEGYIPPEGPTSPQADLFGLGKVLYEAGMGKDRKDFPEPLTGLGEGADAARLLEFNAILLKACAANVTERYRSAEEMNADLALLQSGGSVRRQRRLAGRLRRVQRAGALVTVLAAVISLAWLWQARQTRLVRELAETRAQAVEAGRERVLQLYVARGVQSLKEGDRAGSLQWFAAALPLVAADAQRALAHRVRLTSLLEEQPTPIGLLPAPGASGSAVAKDLRVSDDGRRLLRLAGEVLEVWDLSLPARRVAALPALSETPTLLLLSPDGRKVALLRARAPPVLWKPDETGVTSTLTLGREPACAAWWDFVRHRLVVVTERSELWTFDDRTGAAVDTPIALPEPIALPSPGNRGWFACGPTNGTVSLLDTVAANRVRRLPWGPEWSAPEAVLDGRVGLALAETSGRARLIDPWSGQTVGQTIRHGGSITARAISADDRMLALGSADRVARVWSLATSDALGPPLEHPEAVTAVQFSPDGAQLATADGRGTVRVWELASGRLAVLPLPHAGPVTHLAFARGGSLLATLTHDGWVRLWNVMGPDPVSSSGPMDVPRLVRFSPDGQRVAAAGFHEALFWSTQNDQPPVRVRTSTSGFWTRFRWAPQGDWLALGDAYAGRFRIVNAATGESTGPEYGSTAVPVTDVAFSPDGSILAVGSQDGWLRFVDWRDGRDCRPPLEHDAPLIEVRFLPGGQHLVSVSGISGQAWGRLWSWPEVRSLGPPFPLSAQVIQRLSQGGDRTTALAMNPQADRLAFPAPGAEVRVTDLLGRTIRRVPLPGPTAYASAVEFSPDGARLVVASTDGSVQILPLGTTPPVALSLLHPEEVTSVRFSPDGRILATVAGGALRLWDAVAGEPLTPVWESEGPASTAAGAVDVCLAARFVARVKQDQVVVQRLITEPLPPEILMDLAAWTTGQRLKPDLTLSTLSPTESLELANRLQEAQPARWTLSDQTLARWHERRAFDGGTLAGVRASLCHLAWLQALRPGDPGLDDRRRRLLSRQVQPRDPAAPARLLDLSAAYTASLDTLTSRDLEALPRGIQTLGGVPFDLRGVIRLVREDAYGSVARGVRGGSAPRISHVPVGQPWAKLHFLQGAFGVQAPQGAEVATWIIHYADGSSLRWPLRYGEQVRDWWWFAGRPKEAQDAVLAWEGEAEKARAANARVVLYRTTWVNPRPEIPIRSLECELGSTASSLAIVAITAE